jgi:hypothetical protein
VFVCMCNSALSPFPPINQAGAKNNFEIFGG